MRPTTAKVSKVPEITLVFWIIKIAATRLGDTLSMSMDLGYLLSTAVFGAIFVAAIIAQIRATRFLPFLYWTTLIATTTLGTTLADCADRSLGIGYAGETSLLVALLALSLLSWQRSLGSISIDNVSSPKADLFYWMTIMFSQTLGTALGDWTADWAGLGYGGSAVLFSALLLVVCAHYYWASASRALLFWLAFILTGPLGAFLGDFLDKPVTAGGFALSRYTASAVLVAFCVTCILLSPQRAAKQAH
jgi:uncharacterized membrane-anchored protein